MGKIVRLTESELKKIISQIIEEQAQAPTSKKPNAPAPASNATTQTLSYTFPMDVALVELKFLMPRKVIIKKGTVATALPDKTVVVNTSGGKFIYKPSENYFITESYGLSFYSPDKKLFILKWGDSFFGKVLNQNYYKIAKDLHTKFANLV